MQQMLFGHVGGRGRSKTSNNGMAVLGHCQTVAKKLLGKIQRVCMVVTGFFRTITTVALEVMLNLSSLDMFLQVEAGASAVRLKAQGNWAVPHRRRGHSSICGWWMRGAGTVTDSHDGVRF